MTRSAVGGEIVRVQTYVARGGQQIGNFGEEQLHSLYERGHLLPTDHYWRDGMGEWRTLGELIPAPLVVPPPPRAPIIEVRDRSRWIVAGAIGGVVLFLGAIGALVVAHYGYQKVQDHRVMGEMQKFAKQAQQEAQDSGGKTPIDSRKINTEMQKLQGMSKGENGTDRTLTEETVSLLQEVSQRGQACRDAEKDMLALGFTPLKITTIDDIDQRLRAIEAARPTLLAMINYIINFDPSIRADLIAKGVKPDVADGFIAGMHKAGKNEALLTYWKQEDAISQDLVANLDLLKSHFGQWHVETDKVIFNEDSTLTLYQANVEKLKADIATQQAVQQILARAAP